MVVQWDQDEGAYVARIDAVRVTATADTPLEALRAALKTAGVDVTDSERRSAAASLGRAGGLKGGVARAASLSKKKRAEIAKKAAAARWSKG
jgi:hypothetical protein